MHEAGKIAIATPMIMKNGEQQQKSTKQGAGELFNMAKMNRNRIFPKGPEDNLEEYLESQGSYAHIIEDNSLGFNLKSPSRNSGPSSHHAKGKSVVSPGVFLPNLIIAPEGRRRSSNILYSKMDSQGQNLANMSVIQSICSK